MSHSTVEVLPRRAGTNLSVDVSVDGWHGNIPLPPDLGSHARVDHIGIDGHIWAITVHPRASHVRATQIRRVQ